MKLDEAIKALGHHQSFAMFLVSVKAMREDAIGKLADADTEHLQKIAGQIVAYDDILSAAEAETVIRRHWEHL
jgi:hypothetical protein